MPADSSIYFRQQTPDLLGAVNKGLSLGDMIRQRHEQQAVKNAFKSAMVQGPDGNMTLDQPMALSNLYKVSPELGMKYQGAYNTQQAQQLQAEQRRQNTMLNQRKAGFIPVKDETGRVIDMKRDPNFRDPTKSIVMANHQMALRKEQRDIDKYNRELEKEKKALIVPGLGKALTITDAKDLKSAKEMKGKFDSQITEMMDLRKEYGGELFNREAVKRGQQLSKDLLLTYKNLAKLGVLSKADEDIINAIIPADPLEISPSRMFGQDPVLTQLESFKKDSDRQYQEKIRTRLQGGDARADQIARQIPQNQESSLFMDSMGEKAHAGAGAKQTFKTNEIDWAD